MSAKPLTPAFWENSTIADLVACAAARYGDAPAFVYGDTEISYRDLEARVLECAAGLRTAGVEPGDRIAVLAEDRPEWVYAVFGAATLGAHPVFLPVHYTPREMHYGITLTSAETIIVQDRTSEGELLERYAPLFFEGATSTDDSVIEDSAADQLERVYTIDSDINHNTAKSFDTLLASGRDADLSNDVVAAAEPDDTAAILFTSGTTSMPKGVVRTHRNLLPHAVDMGNWYGRSSSDILLDLFPNPSITATNQLLMSVVHGCTYYLLDHYDTDRAIETMTANPITSVSGVDTMLRDLLSHPDLVGIDTTEVTRVIVAMVGGVDPDLGREVEAAFDAPIENPYGMSETNAFTLRSKPDFPFAVRIQAGGKTGYKTGVVVEPGPNDNNADDDAGAIASAETTLKADAVKSTADPDSLVGEFCVKGITVTPGYDDNPAANAAAFDEGGWFHTDDSGSLQIIDGEYYYHFSGRLDDMFQVGGNNVSPNEIETVIAEMNGVSWVGVVGIPHERMGSVPAAFITRDDVSESATPEAVTEYCDGRLAGHKVPRTVFVIEPSEIPTKDGVNGKKLRRDILRDRATDELDA